MSAIKVRAKQLEPFVVYARNTEKLRWHSLGTNSEYMYLTRPYTTYAEVCEPIIVNQHHDAGLDELLFKSMCLFMKLSSSRFPNIIIANLRGMLTKEGNSYFWDGYYGKLLPTSFREVSALRILHGRVFDIHLVPKHPVYLGLISGQARTRIGKVNPSAKVFHKLLQTELFTETKYFDVFDAGSILEAKRDAVRTAGAVTHCKVASITDEISSGREKIICTGITDFKALRGKATIAKENLHITETIADNLQLQPEDACWVI